MFGAFIFQTLSQYLSLTYDIDRALQYRDRMNFFYDLVNKSVKDSDISLRSGASFPTQTSTFTLPGGEYRSLAWCHCIMDILNS